QRKHAKRFRADFFHQEGRGWKACLLATSYDHRPLGREHEAAVRLGDGYLQPRRNAVGVSRPEHVDSHDLSFGIVEADRDELERHDGRQALREIATQRGQVAMRRDRLRYLHEKTQLVGAACQTHTRTSGEWRSMDTARGRRSGSSSELSRIPAPAESRRFFMTDVTACLPAPLRAPTIRACLQAARSATVWRGAVAPARCRARYRFNRNIGTPYPRANPVTISIIAVFLSSHRAVTTPCTAKIGLLRPGDHRLRK